MNILSLPAILVVAIFGRVSEVPAGYYSNCIALRDSIKESVLVKSAECYVDHKGRHHQ